MTPILGTDIDGKPLRAGDRVVLVWARKKYSDQVGKDFVVAGPSTYLWTVPHVLLNVGKSAACEQLRRIDPDTTTWDKVEDAIGWRPDRVREGVV